MSTRDSAFASQIERLTALLPSLWRPQPDDRTLLADWQALPPERWTELVFPYASCTRVEVHR